MSQANDLLERIGEAALPMLGEPGSQVPVTRLARDAWGDWVRSHEPETRPALLAELRTLDGSALASTVAVVVKRLLPGRTSAVQAGLSRYLSALPSLLRFRAGRNLETAEDLSRWLPSALPRFGPGDMPAGVGDRRLRTLVRIDARGEFWLADNPRLPDRPPVVLAFMDDETFATRLLAWHQRVQRGGPAAALLEPEHTYLGAPVPCVQYAAPPGETMAALCREPGIGHTKVFKQLVEGVAALHRRSSPLGVGDLVAGDVLVKRGEAGGVLLLLGEGPAAAEPRRDVLALGRIGRALGLAESESLAAVLADCVAEDPLRRPADAQALLERLEPASLPTSKLATPSLPARAAKRGGRVWDVLGSLEQGETKREKLLSNSIGMPFVLVPAGTFSMGTPEGETGRRDNEGPVHEVVLPYPCYLGVHLVTQSQYETVMGRNPARFQGAAGGTPAHPVECVSWDDAVAFCAALSALPAEHEAGRTYRLPSEAEWEHACRSGSSSPFHFGASLGPTQARFDWNHPYGDAPRAVAVPRTAPVGNFPRNHFGLFDMHGNVWEWCSDWYDDGYYARSPRQGPTGPESGTFRVLRGGSWRNQATTCRAGYRNALPPNQKQPFIGFRVVLIVDEK